MHREPNGCDGRRLLKATECSRLIDELLVGEISEADLIRLEAEISVAPEVRQEYYRRVQLEMLLDQEAESRARNPERIPMRDASVRPAWIALALIALAACVLAGVFIVRRPADSINLGRVASTDGAGATKSTEQSAIGFGLLAGQSNAIWTDQDGKTLAPLSVGSLLNGEPLRLQSGVVHLELFSGVEVVIQGGADFTIVSPMRMAVRSGKVRARVPEPAQGFVIETASGEVVDLGTEFAIDVSQSQSTIEVVEGQVELHQDTAAKRLVEPGKTLSWNRDGTIEVSPLAVDAIGPTEFQRLIDQASTKQLKLWEKQTSDLVADPRLVAHYLSASDESSGRVIVNRATRKMASEGAIVACERSGDRWNRERGALNFSPMGSRVRVNVQGELHGLTLYCWVKINRLNRLYNSLFLTDGHEGREPHWQITQDGRLFFSIKRPDEEEISANQLRQRIFYSPPMWDESMSGRWTMLCSTYDIDELQVAHYVNGAQVSVESFDPEWSINPVQIGAASIGNWSEPMYRTDPHFVVRNLDGSMDEFAILDGALTKYEVTEIYTAGRPHD